MCYNLKIGDSMARSNKGKCRAQRFATAVAWLVMCAWLFAGVATASVGIFENKNANYNMQASGLSASEISVRQVRTVGDASFCANFNRNDVSNIHMNYAVIAGSETEVNEKIKSSVVSKVERYAKSTFNKSYFVMGLIQFSLTEDGAPMTDFSDLASVEMEITVSNNAKNAKDSYRAIFVKTDSATESAIVSGSYDLLDEIDAQTFAGKNVSCRENGKTSGGTNCLLTIDADSDGFIFLMNVGNPQSSTGLIIMIVGIVLSAVLLIVILQIFRSYKREKLRIASNGKYNASEIKEAPKQMTTAGESLSATSSTTVSTQTTAASSTALPKKPSAPPKAPAKPKLPKKD